MKVYGMEMGKFSLGKTKVMKLSDSENMKIKGFGREIQLVDKH